MLVPIHVLSQDGQSIMGQQGGMVWFAHPGAILGRSEYFGSYGQVWYNPYSILRISMPFNGATGHPSKRCRDGALPICFHALSLLCLHTFWHVIPTSFYICNVFFLNLVSVLFDVNLNYS